MGYNSNSYTANHDAYVPVSQKYTAKQIQKGMYFDMVDEYTNAYACTLDSNGGISKDCNSLDLSCISLVSLVGFKVGSSISCINKSTNTNILDSFFCILKHI